VRPAPDHVRRAQSHEFTARIGNPEQGAKGHWLKLGLDLNLAFDLRLRRTDQNEGSQDRGGTDAYKHAVPLSAGFS
jgi:hypothetical protein